MNPRPTDYESVALPTELHWHIKIELLENSRNGSICQDFLDFNLFKFSQKEIVLTSRRNLI